MDFLKANTWKTVCISVCCTTTSFPQYYFMQIESRMQTIAVGQRRTATTSSAPKQQTHRCIEDFEHLIFNHLEIESRTKQFRQFWFTIFVYSFLEPAHKHTIFSPAFKHRPMPMSRSKQTFFRMKWNNNITGHSAHYFSCSKENEFEIEFRFSVALLVICHLNMLHAAWLLFYTLDMLEAHILWHSISSWKNLQHSSIKLC